MCNCPHCGKEISLSKSTGYTFNSTLPAISANNGDDNDGTQYKAKPKVSGLFSYDFGVKTNGGQALMSGIASGALAMVPSIYYELSLLVPVGICICVSSIGYFILTGQHRFLIHKSVTPKKVDQTLTVHAKGVKAPKNEQILALTDTTPEQLKEFAQKVLKGAPLIVASWTGEGGLFSRPQYDRLMSMFELHGYALPNRGNLGRKLTPEGKVFLFSLL